MEQQNREEEKGLRTYYLECILRNKYKLTGLSDVLSNFLIEFYEKLFDDFDPEKIKHFRNAASNLSMMPGPDYKYQIDFYIGLMDKDTLCYKYSKRESIEKIADILGDCTIFETTGYYTNKEGKRIIIDTIKATKFFDKYPEDYAHYKAYKLKEIFNQDSIITNVLPTSSINFNDESEEYVKTIEGIMQEYDFNWNVAVDAYNSGLI